MYRFKASKFKNTAPKVPKKAEGWILDISCGSPTSCGQHIKASAAYMVFNTDTRGGGNLACLPLNDCGRKNKGTLPTIHAHTDLVTDFDFSPFDDGLLATCSTDTTIKLWQIPESGIAEGDSLSSPLFVLSEEMRRVENVLFNPAAEFVLASSSFDTVKVWDLTKQAEVFSNDSLEDQCYGIGWKGDGSLLASVCKDQQMRIFDPRSNPIALQSKNHASPKDTRVAWVGDTDRIVTTGFNSSRQREVILRDTRNIETPLYSVELDRATGVLMPLFDPDTNLLFLAGKGECTIMLWEVANQDPFLTEATKHVSEVQSKGACLVPKRSMDVMQAEVNRLLQLSSKCIIPIMFQVPRRSYRDYHSELFPDTVGPVPGMTCKDWLENRNNLPPKISLNPDNRPEDGFIRFSVNPKENDSSIPHGQTRPADTKTVQNGMTSTKLNDDKTAKDNQNLNTQNKFEAPHLQPVTANKPSLAQKPSVSQQEVSDEKESRKITGDNTQEKNELASDNVKSRQKEFQEKINSANEDSPVLRRKDLPSNKDVQRVSSFKTPSRPTSKVFQMRTSKFRHLKGVPMHQKQHIENIRNINRSIPSESNGFACNRKYAAVPLGGPGGQIAILELAKTGKLGDGVLSKVICGVKAMDFEWDPFNDNKLVTVCDDGKMLIWNIPEGGLTESTNEPSESIDAHREKIYIVKFHPFASNIVATASFDMTIKIWDLLNPEKPKITLEDHGDQIFCMSWSPDGEYIATVCKDKKVRIYQPRVGTNPIKESTGPPGVRGARVAWVLDGEGLLVSGFDNRSGRILYLYETANMAKPLTTLEIDVSPAILVPFYEEDSSTVFLAAKGEGTILAYEVAYDAPYFHQLSHVKCSCAHQALTFLPKIACNVREVEFARGLRLLPSSIEPMVFTVPRVKKEFFQNDLFPNTRVTWEESMSGTDWLAGKRGGARKVSLRPADMKNWINEKSEDKETKVESVSKSASNRTASPVRNVEKSEKEKSEMLVSAMKDKFTLESGDLPQQNFDGVDSNEWDED